MDLDPGIGSIDEHVAQVLDVLLDALGGVSVGPMDEDILRMAAMQFCPLLIGEHVVVQVIEDVEVRLDQPLGLRVVHGLRLGCVGGLNCGCARQRDGQGEEGPAKEGS